MFGSTFNPSMLPDLFGKIVIVTGGNNGIGKTTALNLLKKNAKVYIAARDSSKAQATIAELKKTSVKAATEEYLSKETELHILINNAGVMGIPYAPSPDGYEIQWATNCMGHYLFTKLLLPVLLHTAKSSKDPIRIVNLTSDYHASGPKGGIIFGNVNLPDSGAMSRYGQSKLANILHTKALAKRYSKENNIIINTVHPGIVQTGLSDKFLASKGIPGGLLMTILSPFFLTVEKGCWTTLYAAASKEVTVADNGVYFTSPCEEN